jgi:hypothetical protein
LLFNGPDHSMFIALRNDNDNVYLMLSYQGDQAHQHRLRSLQHLVECFLRNQYPQVRAYQLLVLLNSTKLLYGTYVIDTEKSARQEILQNLAVPKISQWEFPTTYSVESVSIVSLSR